MEFKENESLLLTNMILQIPLSLIIPSIEEIHSHYSQVLNNIINSHKNVVMWGQRTYKIGVDRK